MLHSFFVSEIPVCPHVSFLPVIACKL